MCWNRKRNKVFFLFYFIGEKRKKSPKRIHIEKKEVWKEYEEKKKIGLLFVGIEEKEGISFSVADWKEDKEEFP